MKPVMYAILFTAAVLAAAAAVFAAQRRGPGESPTLAELVARQVTAPTPPAAGEATPPMNTAIKPAAAPVLSRSAFDVTPLSQARIDELAKKLAPDEAKVILRKGTEPAFCGTLLDNKKDGTYLCRLCALPLFSSEHKFNSGTGWPSFFQPYDRDHIRYEKDTAYGMERIEILCARCTAHLGHVFEDGPRPTGLRYCLNSASLSFLDKGSDWPDTAKPVATKDAYFAGGCFWGVEDRFQQLPGVVSAVSGYQGGKTDKPTYKEVCNGDTNHAETVRITYDPTKITYRELLEKFFKFHDPTTLNRQGPDIGTQYRSAIFAVDDEQYAEAKSFVEEQATNPRFKGRRVVTQVQKVAEAGPFHAAEEYHQDYHEKHGGHCALPPEE